MEADYEQLKRDYSLDGRKTLSTYLNQTMFGYNPGAAEKALGRQKEQARDLPYIGLGVAFSAAGSSLSLML